MSLLLELCTKVVVGEIIWCLGFIFKYAGGKKKKCVYGRVDSRCIRMVGSC